MNNWECDSTADKPLEYEYTEILTPTMQLAYDEDEEGNTFLVQLHHTSSGEEKWVPIQDLGNEYYLD